MKYKLLNERIENSTILSKLKSTCGLLLGSFLALLLTSINLNAQTTIATTFANNNGSSVVVFSVQNNNAYDIILTDIGSFAGTTATYSCFLYAKTATYNTAPGAAGAITAANGWSVVGSNTSLALTANTTGTGMAATPFITGMNYTIPAMTHVRLALQLATGAGLPAFTTTAGSLRYSTVTGTCSFSGGSVDLNSCANYGYGGTLSSPSNSPRGLVGYISFIPAVACAGTPTPGNTVSTANPVCPNTNFTLSLQTSSGMGSTYQWESADDAAFTTNVVSLGTSSSQTTSQTTDKYYRCLVTCTNSGLSAYSTPLLVTTNSPIACYCIPSVSSGCGLDYISNVNINGINRTSACDGSTNGYSSYSTPNPTFMAGNSYPLSVTTGGDTEGAGVWIDFNGDGQFDDATEFVLNGYAGTNPATYTSTVNIPITATPGQTMMRVRCAYATNPNTFASPKSCAATTYGETEDYLITIAASTACTGTPEAGSITPITQQICSSIPFTVTATGMTVAGGLTFQWQNSTDGGNTWTNISGANNTSYAVAGGISVATSYRMYVVCANGGASDTTNASAYTIKPASQCYCDVSGGTSTYYFSNVNTTGGMTNFNNSHAGLSSGYTDFSGTYSASQIPGGTVNYSLTMANGETAGMGVWIDWNQNGSFADAGEQIYVSGGYVPSATGTLTVPLSATVGTTKMRVGLHWLNTAPGPCGPISASYTSYEDYAFTVISQTNCSGTPAPGNTVASANPSCFVDGLTLTTSNPMTDLGLTFDWQTSPDGITWTSTGVATPTYTLNQSVATWYQCVVTCTNSGLSATSTPVSVGQTICYCTTPVYSYNAGYNMCTYFNFIGQVNFSTAGINNTTSCDANPPYYHYYSAMTGSVDRTSSYPITISATAGGSSFQLYKVYIDYNDNGSFDDVGEMVFSSGSISTAVNSASGVITIPADAPLGTHRMRVRSTNPLASNIDANSCSDDGYLGEVEDYNITVNPAPPCAGTPSPGATLSNEALVCGTTSINLSLQNATSGTGVTYQWQSSSDLAFTSPVNLGTSATQTTTQTATTYYRCLVTCDGNTGTSTPVLVTYDDNCYCTNPVIGSNGCALNLYINNVTFAGINNTSGCFSPIPYTTPYYSFFPDQMAYVQKGLSYPFSVTSPSTGDGYYQWFGVWIDYNDNGSFEDAGELVLSSVAGATVQTNSLSGNILIPSTANSGKLLMRVRSGNMSTAFNSCTESSSSGETEDYWVSICQDVIPTVSITNVSSCGYTDGAITLSGLDLNTTYTVALKLNGSPLTPVTATTDGAGALVLTNLAVGSYTDIIATSPIGCNTFSVYGDVGEGPLPATVVGVNSTACAGDVPDGQLVIHGLLTGYTYDVAYVYSSMNDTAFGLTVAGDSIIVTGLDAGTYSDIVVYSAVCTSATLAPVTITEPVKPLIIAAPNNPNTNCTAPNGDILISSAQFSDLESYTVWYNGAAQGSFMPSGSIITVGGLAGGAYTDIHVITADGCPSDTVASVDVIGASSPALITDVVPIDDLSCGSNVEIRLVGAFPPTADVYYMFNETVASAFGGANLTGDTMVIFSLPSGVYSDFQINDAGCLSNVFDTTLYLYSGVPDSVIASSTSSGGNIQGAPVGVYYSNTACELIANIESTDSLGNVTVDVNVGNAAVFTGTMDPEPYVGRYYSIHADENNGGTVTLFFDQADLDSYNTLASGMGFPEILSANGYADLRITAFHSLPGSGNGVLNYDTATAELITPSSVVWNATYNRLEVTFTVTQFSGFFAHSTLNNMPLPVVMGNIKAANLGATNRVDWDTKDEQAGDRFVIERSADARSFTAIGNTDAKGIAGSKYSFIDAEPYTGINYYRLQILGNDGSQYYSKVVHATVAGEGLTLTAFPNPVSDVLTVKAQGNVEGKGALLLMDASGRVIAKRGIESNGTATFDMQHLAQGMYVIKFADDKGSQLIKVTKK